MRRFEDILSPVSWLVMLIGFLPLILIVFQPTGQELAVILAVDYASLWLFRAIDRRLFLRLFPDARPYFLDQSPAESGARSVERGLSVFDSLVRFPRRRALYCALLSFAKVAPAVLVLVFFCHHSVSNGVQLLKALSLVSLTISYFYGAVYIESHRIVSRKIAEFHRDLNWSEVFASARIPFTRWDFKVQEAVSVSSILIAQFWLQWLVGTAGRSASSYVGLREAAISSAGILLIARLWILEKHYFIGGLKAIFRNVENLSPADAKRSLPLHSSPLLAGFEGAYNALLGRLADYQRELSHWIQYQTEESRYQALGEISALTLHDISAPIQVIQFFAERVRESPDCLKNPEYVRQLSDNVDKAVQMIRSLRSYLADPTAGAASVDYGTCHSHVFQLLETQFRSRGLSSIRLTADPRLMPLRLKVTKVDLTHVMFNLLKNGIENLLATETSEPAIAISLRERGEDYAVLCVEDNGSGLTPERYELLTSIAHSGTVVRESMGLRLIRRVVERNQGSLTVDAPSGRGTCFLLRLPLETAGNDGPLKRFTGATSETIAGWSAPASRSEKVPAPAPAASRGSGSTDP